MGERIDLPQTPQGTAEEQLRQMYSYLYRVAEALNHNLSEIGSMDLTDDERIIMQQITAEEEGAEVAAYDWQGKESLKSLIIKTAAFVQNKLDNYRLNLLGEYVTEGKFGKYVRNTSLKVDVTPTGIQQDYTFEEVVQGLKNYTVNAKNYIKTGLLRTVQGLPVYGVAIGKDVVTFSEEGTETYNDGNKVAELTADELSFYQNNNKVASYKGNRISFLISGTEVFYIESGKIHSNIDLELSSGKKLIINTSNFKVDSSGNVEIIGSIKAGSTFAGTMSANCITSGSIDASVITVNNLNASNITSGTMSASKINGGTLTLGGNNNTNGTMQIKNGSGTVVGTFDKDGISYSGNMSISSGGSFSVDSTNFKINSTNNTIKAGSWTISASGLRNQIGADTDMNRIIYSIDTYNDKLRFCAEKPAIGDIAYWTLGDGGALIPYNNYVVTPPIRNQIGTSAYAPDIYYYNLYQASSREAKHDIEPLPDMGEKIDQLNPVSFVYDDDAGEQRRNGLIYEDTLPVMPEICTGDEGQKAINYVELIPVLVKEIQSLRQRVSELERRYEDVRDSGNADE